jgi:hypothetical protein
MANRMTKPTNEDTEFWRVRVCLPGSIIHLASKTEPQVEFRDGRVANVKMNLIPGAEYGDTVGFIDWSPWRLSRGGTHDHRLPEQHAGHTPHMHTHAHPLRGLCCACRQSAGCTSRTFRTCAVCAGCAALPSLSRAGLNGEQFEAAMRRLFAAGKIWNEPYGRASRQSHRLAIRP